MWRVRACSGRAAVGCVLALCLSGCESSTTAPRAAVSLATVAGQGQVGTAGAALSEPLVVEARDESGSPVAGVRVRFSVVAGGGSAHPSDGVTGDDGRASVEWTLGTNAQAPQRLRATLDEEGADAAVDVEADVVAGPPANLEAVRGDGQKAQRLTELREALVIRVADGFGNPVSGATVGFAVTGGDGALESTSATTDDEGEASTRWRLGSSLGEQTVTATVGSLSGVSFSATALEHPWIGGIVTSASSGDLEAFSPRDGDPGSDPTAPDVTVTGSEVVIPGGGAFYELTADGDASVLYVFVQGTEGYYRLERTSSADTPFELILTLQDTLGAESYELQFAVGTGAGAGPRGSLITEVHDVPTGPLQVSVTWDVPSDVDLYLVEPSGETIYFENDSTVTGGTLDLDANGGCIGEDLRNESITWRTEPPPRGTYVVRVNLWSSCTQETTNWLVTVRIEGQPPRTVRGQFTGEGSGGDRNSGRFVTTFTY